MGPKVSPPAPVQKNDFVGSGRGGGDYWVFATTKELPFTRSLSVQLVPASHPWMSQVSSSIGPIFVNCKLDTGSVYPTLLLKPSYLILHYTVVLMPLFFLISFIVETKR
jgi:hypothetical protein